ncbi:hypothetical protein [Actinomadura alba]|uniref:Uncharacterized protein n=1 Tax=Actinomadura alba TaxID=406431 RepID=A0ABR7LQ10_9ACTN|nr:hypothetical protein [Actinomadura alba]MBC6466937.1 hypothetical protein [Actinomadura alba]
MTEWVIWRQDDGGNEYRMSVHHDRIEALARVLALEAGPVHKQMYWVAGPPGPVCRTDRDLYVRLVGAGRRMVAAGRTLDEFLRAWWLVGRPMAARPRLEPDAVAAMITAATVIDPPPLRAAWRTASYESTPVPADHSGWEQVVLSQIADLADLADEAGVGGAVPADTPASGANVPRPPGVVRATGVRWYNLDPQAYLECGAASSLRGREGADGSSSGAPGSIAPPTARAEPGERLPDALSWADLVRLSHCGQGEPGL